MLLSSPCVTIFLVLFAFTLLSSEVKHVRAKNNVEGRKRGLKASKKSTLKSEKKSKKSKKSFQTERGDFLSFTFNMLDQLEKEVCEINEENCQAVKIFQEGGIERGYQNLLPTRYYANFRAMCLAYSVDFRNPELYPYFLKVLRLHRTLGLGDGLRLLGNTEKIVEKGYWHHYNLLELEDNNDPGPGDGLSTYCSYTSDEYEQLKKFAVDNFEEDFSSSLTFGLNSPPTPFYSFCMLSYPVRSDWEHHRKQMVSSLMSSDSTEAIVQYTIWHWESLFVFASSAVIGSAQLFNSFDVLLNIQ